MWNTRRSWLAAPGAVKVTRAVRRCDVEQVVVDRIHGRTALAALTAVIVILVPHGEPISDSMGSPRAIIALVAKLK